MISEDHKQWVRNHAEHFLGRHRDYRFPAKICDDSHKQGYEVRDDNGKMIIWSPSLDSAEYYVEYYNSLENAKYVTCPNCCRLESESIGNLKVFKNKDGNYICGWCGYDGFLTDESVPIAKW